MRALFFLVCLSVLGCSSTSDRADAATEPDAATDAGPPRPDTNAVACVSRCEACSLWMCGPLCESGRGPCIAASTTCAEATDCLAGPRSDAGR